MNKELKLKMKINETEILITESNNRQAVISSRDIARVFEKEHGKVIRAIEALPNDKYRQANFGLSKYTKDLQDGSGVHSYKEYLITKDGFSLLVMGFTGEKAYRWKIAFIDAFNKMEQAIKEQKQYSLPKTYKEALQELIEKVEENEKLQERIAQDKPKVILAEAVSGSDSSISVGQFAKILKQNGVETGRQRLFNFFRDNGYLIRGRTKDFNMPTQRSMEQGLFEVQEKAVTLKDKTILSLSPRVTGKGQEYFLRLFLNKGELVG